MVRKIISGGQTGADQGGLEAGRALGLETGGVMPRGYRTELYDRPDFAVLYGVVESHSRDYPPRTADNVRDSDGTVVIGNLNSPGSRLTVTLCGRRKPFFVVDLKPPLLSSLSNYPIGRRALEFQLWLTENHVNVLNVAGSRESKLPGIRVFVRDFVMENVRVVNDSNLGIKHK